MSEQEYPSREVKDPALRELCGPDVRVYDWPPPWWHGTEKDRVILFGTSDATCSAVPL